jgi:hypothetical protein
MVTVIVPVRPICRSIDLPLLSGLEPLLSAV